MIKRRIGIITASVIMLTLISGFSAFADETNIPLIENSDKDAISKYVAEQYPNLESSEKKELEEEIYQEKYTISMVSEIEEEDEEFVDVAYENMLQRETYVVDLISRLSGAETTLDSWEYNLDYLQLHYDEIMSLENVNLLYVDRYIEDYEIVRQTKDMPATQINEVRTRATSYSYSDAVKYAESYCFYYNPSYPDWSDQGGDCANFISQCLHAGGKSMVGTPGSSTAAQNWSNWFSTGSSCNTSNVSSTWRGANAFKGYWMYNASGYNTFSSVGASSYSYGFAGDAVSLLNSNGNAYHTVIIVGYDSSNKDFIVAAHTRDTRTAKLSDYSAVGGFIIYNMR